MGNNLYIHNSNKQVRLSNKILNKIINQFSNLISKHLCLPSNNRINNNIHYKLSNNRLINNNIHHRNRIKYKIKI